ncbi:helix-turn-helix domain-containing protein, partial [Photobacterium sanctipauli]
ASVSPELEQQLLNHRWNNNVRELRTFAERFILMGEQASIFSPSSIHTNPTQEPATLADRVSQFESKLLRDALNRHQGRLKDVQQELGLARKTLYDKMKKHG